MNDDETLEERRKRHDENWEKQRRDENIKIARAIVTAVGSLFKRQQKVDDPSLRSCLFVDKLSCMLDISMAILITQVDDEWPEDLKLQIHTLNNTVNQELENLMTWCRSPTFSPDAPFGEHLMKSSKYYESAKQNDN